MDKKIYIFGTNALAELLYYYLTEQGKTVIGYTLNERYISTNTYAGNPILPIEKEIDKYGVNNISVYVAIAYAHMNRVRQSVFAWLEQQQIELMTFIHPSATIANNVILGKGNIILENVSIQPFCTIGESNIIWNNTTISHHSSIGSFNYITAGVTIAGRVTLGDRNFLGCNCTVRNDVLLGNETIIGASVYVDRPVDDYKVYLPARGIILQGKTSADINIDKIKRVNNDV